MPRQQPCLFEMLLEAGTTNQDIQPIFHNTYQGGISNKPPDIELLGLGPSLGSTQELKNHNSAAGGPGPTIEKRRSFKKTLPHLRKWIKRSLHLYVGGLSHAAIKHADKILKGEYSYNKNYQCFFHFWVFITTISHNLDIDVDILTQSFQKYIDQLEPEKAGDEQVKAILTEMLKCMNLKPRNYRKFVDNFWGHVNRSDRYVTCVELIPHWIAQSEAWIANLETVTLDSR